MTAGVLGAFMAVVCAFDYGGLFSVRVTPSARSKVRGKVKVSGQGQRQDRISGLCQIFRGMVYISSAGPSLGLEQK